LGLFSRYLYSAQTMVFTIAHKAINTISY
jgi:hypothetical protein